MFIEENAGRGSGFFVDPAGYILTNAHVIEGSWQLTVALDNGALFEPRVVVSDAERDIALLKITSTRQMPALSFATTAHTGDWSSGFLFRWKPGSDINSDPVFHVVVIADNGYWYHYLRTRGNGSEDQLIASNFSNHINIGPSDSNHIRIITIGEEGSLFINEYYVAKLNLDGLLEEGRIYAVGSFSAGHGIAGKSTRFEDFTIRPIRDSQ